MFSGLDNAAASSSNGDSKRETMMLQVQNSDPNELGTVVISNRDNVSTGRSKMYQFP